MINTYYETKKARPPKYPFDDLEIGESFDSENPTMTLRSARTVCCKMARQLNKKFFVYQLSTGTISVVRVA